MATQNLIKLKNVRLSFPEIFHKKSFQGGIPAYSAAFLMDKSTPEGKAAIKTLTDAIKKLAMDTWGEIPPNAKPGAAKCCFRDGDDKDLAGYPGHMYISTRNGKVRPQLANRDNSPIVEEDGVLYPGCYVNAIVSLWAQDNTWGKAINANLVGIQFVKDGEAFGAVAPPIRDLFDEIDEVEEEDMFG